MKKIVFVAIWLILIISLVACENNKSNNHNKNEPTPNNTLSVATLTDREKAILSTVTDKSFVFDFNVDGTYKKVSVWVEKYELGKRVENEINYMTDELNKKDMKGTIIFATSKMVENQSLFTVSISDESGTSSSSVETKTEDGLKGFSSLWGSNQVKNIPIKGEMVLASICYSKKNSMSSLSTDFYNDPDGHINEIKNYDMVYLLKVKFTK